jgi:hypothetical protein
MTGLGEVVIFELRSPTAFGSYAAIGGQVRSGRLRKCDCVRSESASRAEWICGGFLLAEILTR